MTLVLILTIVINDMRTHRISNRSSGLLFLLLICQPKLAPLLSIFVVIVISILIFTVAHVGMGDLKLWIAMVITRGEDVISLRYLQGLLVVSTVSAAISFLRGRDFRKEIPFGPSLLLPFVPIYLGI